MSRSTSFLALAAILTSLFASAPAAARDDEDREVAATLFRESAEAYREGRFDVAVALLERAYELDPAPVLQYNLARALEGMGELERAVAAYELFIELDPDASDRGAIEARLVTLRRQLEERRELEARAEAETETEAEVTAPEPQPERIEPPARANPVPWAMLGAGVLVAGGAIATGVVGSNRHDEAVEAMSHSEAVRLADQADRLARTTNALLAVGGALVVAGVVWGAIDVSSLGDEDQVQVSLSPTGVSLRGRF